MIRYCYIVERELGVHSLKNTRNIFIWLIIGLLLISLYSLFNKSRSDFNRNEINFSQFLAEVATGNVSEVTISGEKVEGLFSDSRRFVSYIPLSDPTLISRLNEQGVNITVEPNDSDSISIWSVLLSWFPMIFLIAVWVFFMKQMQSGGGKIMGFGGSKARLLTEIQERITFNDVAGIDEAKDELQEIVAFLKDSNKFQKLGGRIPKGALLVGPPGTGKTLLARAVAGEADVPFFLISGSDFVEMFVGIGASRVRDMFEQAKKHMPCIIFVDEIDAVGRHRGAGLGGGNDEREQTLNQLLVEMDGFNSNDGIILIAATNRPDVLDPALLRPGRFDRQIIVSLPDIIGREQILQVHIKKIRIGTDIALRTLARGTPGFSGADLANLVNEAALLAARRNKRVVSMVEFENAKDKIMMGAERRSMVMTEEEKSLTAYHEGGHALVALNLEDSDPIHKATIIPRGRALGMVMRLPERDQISMTRAKLKADLAVAMGGRIAEEIIFGYEKVTSGASSDIQMATNMAKAMVTQFGMSDALGPLSYGDNQQEIFLGHSVTKTSNTSDVTQNKIDGEIRRLIDESYQTAEAIIREKLNDLHIIAKGLLEFETLSGEEIRALLKGTPPKRLVPTDTNIDNTRGSLSSVPKTGKNKPVGDIKPQGV